MIRKAKAWAAKIYVSGPIEAAKQIMREEAAGHGLCVTIDPTTYVYTGGEEAGYVVGLIQYARFPSEESALLERTLKIAEKLRDLTFQASCTVLTPDESIYLQSERIKK